MDERALADVARDVEAQRTHVVAMCSAGGTATMASEHAPRIQSAGGKASRKKGSYKKPHQTAAQAANAAYQRKYQAAKRAKLAGGAH